MSPFWKIDVALTKGYIIALVNAEDHPQACELLGEEIYSRKVRACTTPDLVELMARLPPGHVHCTVRDRIPSAYDRFGLGTGRMDYQSMTEAGFDVM